MEWIRSISQAHIQAKKVMSSYAGTTFRFEAYNAIAGEKSRLTLSNQWGDTPVEIISINIKQNQLIHPVLFNQVQTLIIDPQRMVMSDEIPFSIGKGMVEIIIAFGEGERVASGNYGVYFGEVSSPKNPEHFRKAMGCPCFASLDVYGEGSALVLCGDSFIHQGTWVKEIETYFKNHSTPIATINHGISGNQLCGEPPADLVFYGPSIQSRFQKDVMDVPGVRRVVLDGGVNDILLNPSCDIDYLLKQTFKMIKACLDYGLEVWVFTFPPAQGYEAYQPVMKEKIKQYNNYLRESIYQDHVIDVYNILQQADRLKAVYDSGDHLHPNREGYHEIFLKLIPFLSESEQRQ